MRKETIASTNIEFKVGTVDNTPHWVINITGISRKSYESNKRNKWLQRKQVQVVIPMWAVPSMNKRQRDAIGEWLKSEAERLNNIKQSFQKQIPEPTL